MDHIISSPSSSSSFIRTQGPNNGVPEGLLSGESAIMSSSPLAEIPSLPPPPGVKPNFIDPPDAAVVDYGITAMAICLTTVIVCLRIYSKLTIKGLCTADDFVLLAGWAAFVAYCAVIIVMAENGIARHQWNISMERITHILHLLFADMAMYCVVTALIKVSIFLQFLTIFNPTRQRGFMYWSCWVCIGFFSTFYFATMMAGVFVCNPIERWWIVWTPGHCRNRRSIPVITSSGNIAADLIILLLPQRAIWQLKMSLAKKLRVSLIFFIGLFALAASIFRLRYTMLLVASADVTWNVNTMGLWTLAEMVTTITCSSAPSLAGLVKKWKQKLTSSIDKVFSRRDYSNLRARNGSMHEKPQLMCQHGRSASDLSDNRFAGERDLTKGKGSPIVIQEFHVEPRDDWV